MSVGTQFLALVDMLRNEIGRSTNVGIGIEDIPGVKRAINRSYAMLLLNYDWPHLRYLPNRITISAGQRYYDIPANIEPSQITEIVGWQSANLPIPLERGISYHEYSAIDSENAQRSDPPQKWDFRFNGTATQIEIWPIPNSNTMTLQITGRYRLPKLVADQDLCMLDDELVVLGATHRLLARQKSEDAGDAKTDFEARLMDVRKNNGPSRTVIMGTGTISARDKPRISIRR